VEDVTVNTWTLRGFVAESATQDESPLELDLTLGDTRVEGTVRNRGSVPLQDVALLMGRNVEHLGTLSVGEEKRVELSVSRNAFDPAIYGSLLPPPSGATVGSYGPYYDGRALSDERRLYNRKWMLLRTTLQRVASYAPPAGIEVLAFAWGPQRDDSFRVQGNAREEGVTLWMSRDIVSTSDGAALDTGWVPYSIYAPGNMFYRPPRPDQGTLDLHLAPYVDIILRLPIGARPGSINVKYDLVSTPPGRVAVQAYDPLAGTWVPAGEIEELSTGTSVQSQFDIPKPGTYVGPSGDLTLRLVPTVDGQQLTFTTLEFGMNDTP
jgi:hypothetical protein